MGLRQRGAWKNGETLGRFRLGCWLFNDKGKYVTVYRKQPDGKWKVVADIFNSDLPAPAPPKQ